MYVGKETTSHTLRGRVERVISTHTALSAHLGGGLAFVGIPVVNLCLCPSLTVQQCSYLSPMLPIITTTPQYMPCVLTKGMLYGQIEPLILYGVP